MIVAIAFTMLAAWTAESAVLDPALFLAPSPPLMLVSDSISPGEMWGRSIEERTDMIARGAAENIEIIETTTLKPVAMESRMFWPRFGSPQPALGINIPLTFSLSGSYGKAALPTGVIGNTYASVTGLGTSVAGLGTSVTGIGTSVTGIGTSVTGLGTSVTGLRTLGSSLFGKSAVAGVYGNYGRSGLAGSSYGTYGTSAVRVYGGDNLAAWGGWGNGKWGHYGKG